MGEAGPKGRSWSKGEELVKRGRAGQRGGAG